MFLPRAHNFCSCVFFIKQIDFYRLCKHLLMNVSQCYSLCRFLLTWNTDHSFWENRSDIRSWVKFFFTYWWKFWSCVRTLYTAIRRSYFRWRTTWHFFFHHTQQKSLSTSEKLGVTEFGLLSKGLLSWIILSENLGIFFSLSFGELVLSDIFDTLH